MITTICFDVHGTSAAEIHDKATTTLREFSGDGLNFGNWTVHIECHEEAASLDGAVAMWRGEVTARHHGSAL